MEKVFTAILILIVLMVLGLIFLFVTINSNNTSLNTKISSLNKSISGQLNSINNSVQLESEQHFINIQNKVKSSVVAVISYPIRNNSGTSVIYVDNKIGYASLGTGFSIDKNGDILTAYHVIRNTSITVIILPNNTQIQITKIHPIPSLDLAILYTNSSVPPVVIQNNVSSAITGLSIGFVGFPITQNGSSSLTEVGTKGTIGAVNPNFPYSSNTFAPVYYLSALGNHGDSGGPVFSLVTGQVIGIVNAQFGFANGIIISTAIDKNLINTLFKN